MARHSDMTISELRGMLHKQEKQLNKLYRKRATLEKRLAVIDDDIKSRGGSVDGRSRLAGRSRVRNDVSLPDVIAEILSKHAKPMKVSDITEAVTSTGYKTNSANFRVIVNQALIKDKRFVQSERGMYVFKK